MNKTFVYQVGNNKKLKQICFKYIAVFFIKQPHFANLTHRHLIEKKNILFNFATGPFIAQVLLNGPHCFNQGAQYIT